MIEFRQALRRVLSSSLIILFVGYTCTNLGQWTTERVFKSEFSVVSECADSAHVKSCGGEVKMVEREYLLVRVLVGASYVENKVVVLRAGTLYDDGSIGSHRKHPIVGVYTNGVIVYDGDVETLRHELAHFFFDKLTDHDKSEMFAQLLEKIFYVLQRK